MTQLKMLSADDKLTEIRRLYFSSSRQSIQQDLTKALDLLKSMSTEEERERATVYMEGLAEMAKDWSRDSKPRGAGKGGPPKKAAPKAGTKGAGKSAARPAARRPGTRPVSGAKKKG